MTVVSLTTDFGTGDHEAGVLKGVIWKIAPDVKIVDLSHEISPQDVLEGALLLWRNAHYFPNGSVHVGVVDPGVGTKRRVVAGYLGGQYYVGPDNGLFSLAQKRVEDAGGEVSWYELDKPEYWLPKVTNIFHGRDVFSPAGAHLAAGVTLESMGSPIADTARLEFPMPEQLASGWKAPVIHTDYFGNLAVNLTVEQLGNKSEARIRAGNQEIVGISRTFGEKQPGELVALFDSSGMLSLAVVNGSAAKSLAVVNGSAAKRLKLSNGDWIWITCD